MSSDCTSGRISLQKAVCSRVQTPLVCKTPQHCAIPRGVPGGDLSPSLPRHGVCGHHSGQLPTETRSARGDSLLQYPLGHGARITLHAPLNTSHHSS